MKIVFIGGSDVGGIASYMLNLNRQLVEKGHQTAIYFESDRNHIDYIDGIKIVYLKPCGGKYLNMIYISFVGTIKALIGERNVDVYHYNNGFMLPLFGWIIKLFNPRSKVVIQTHSFAWMSPKYSNKIKTIIKLGERFSVFPYKNFIVVSTEQQTVFRTCYHKEATVISSAVNAPVVNNPSDILIRYNLLKDGYFLFLGRLDKIKNIDILIKAYCLSGIDTKQLVIAGSNDSDPEYVCYLHQLASANTNIIFTGAVYGEDKEALIENCFVACLQSSSEGSPISLLEAMSYGKICITSDIAGNREVIGDESCWVEVGDFKGLTNAMCQLVSDYKELEYMGRRNRDRALQHYTWDKVSERYLTYLANL